ncbi:MAG: hypothetical protein OEM52_07395 [bacterium]|nr:hypothetical protein [bacterium]
MKVKYLIDALLIDDIAGGLTWKPVGVWAVEVGAQSLAFEWAYLPGNPERESEADRVATAMVEAGIQVIPEDFLEYHQSAYNSYTGQFYGPFEEEFANLPVGCKEIIARIAKGELGLTDG